MIYEKALNNQTAEILIINRPLKYHLYQRIMDGRKTQDRIYSLNKLS